MVDATQTTEEDLTPVRAAQTMPQCLRFVIVILFTKEYRILLNFYTKINFTVQDNHLMNFLISNDLVYHSSTKGNRFPVVIT